MSTHIQNLFKGIADTYERLNSMITFGLDSGWRKRAAETAAEEGGSMWLDMCTGTGDMAVLLTERAGSGIQIISADFSMPMMAKARKKKKLDKVFFTMAEAGNLPFLDQTFDLVTVSFATRNLNTNRRELQNRFAEFLRVLKPGGRLVIVETSQPESLFLRNLFHTYVEILVRRLGQFISGSRASYGYLASSIQKFYDANELSYIIDQTGFSTVNYESLSFGIAAIHIALKGEN